MVDGWQPTIKHGKGHLRMLLTERNSVEKIHSKQTGHKMSETEEISLRLFVK